MPSVGLLMLGRIETLRYFVASQLLDMKVAFKASSNYMTPATPESSRPSKSGSVDQCARSVYRSRGAVHLGCLEEMPRPGSDSAGLVHS